MSLQASFIGSVGPIFFKGYEFSFFLIKTLLIWKISLNSRLIRLDQHEKTFTGKNPRENASNIILLAESVVFSYVAKWSERLRGVQAVRVQASIEPNFFFGCFCLFAFCFFLLLVRFSLILLLALRLSFTRCCDIRISELFVWSGVTRYG